MSSALLLASGAPAVRAQCDSAYVNVTGQPVRGMGAAAPASATDTLNTSFAKGSGVLHIELVPRVFEAAVHADNSLYISGEARDEYRIVGAPAGTEVTFRVRAIGTFDVMYRVHCGGSGCIPVAFLSVDGSDVNEHLEFLGLGGFVTALVPFERSMTLVRRAEEPFLLRYYVTAGTSHTPSYVGLSARVEFDQLPPGVRVESCLEANLPTANRRATWGSLKAMYR